ncbi:MAG: ATP-binding protein [Acidimicrobiia bacterium]
MAARIDDPDIPAPFDSGRFPAFADVGFWEYDLSTEALYLSTQVFQILSIDTATVEACFGAVHPDDVDLLRHVHLRARHQPGPYQVRCRPADGERVLQIRAQSVADADGTPVRYLGMISDVTADWQLELALEHSTAARLTGLAATSAVHDLKNLFTVVLGHTHLVTVATASGRTPEAGCLAALERSAQRGLELTSQLLDVGRTGPVTARPVAVAATLQRLAITAATVLGRHRHLEVDAGDGTVDLLADATRLERVLVDLVLNARDALPPQQGSVRVSFRKMSPDEVNQLRDSSGIPDGSYGLLEVRDDGTGMDPEVLARVTDPFFTTKAASGGSGVGMHTVARFVDAAGGALRIKSTPGQGTSVQLVLPTRPSTAAANRRAGRARVLVSGHDELRLAALARALELSGVQAVVGVTPSASIRLLRTEPIDLVVSDAQAGEDRWLLRTAAATATPVLGVAGTLGSTTSDGPLTDDALEALAREVDRLLQRAPAHTSA